MSVRLSGALCFRFIEILRPISVKLVTTTVPPHASCAVQGIVFRTISYKQYFGQNFPLGLLANAKGGSRIPPGVIHQPSSWTSTKNCGKFLKKRTKARKMDSLTDSLIVLLSRFIYFINNNMNDTFVEVLDDRETFFNNNNNNHQNGNIETYESHIEHFVEIRLAFLTETVFMPCFYQTNVNILSLHKRFFYCVQYYSHLMNKLRTFS